MKSKTLGKYSIQRTVDETKLKFVRATTSHRTPGLHAEQPFCQRTSSRSLQLTMYALEPGWLLRLLLSCDLL